MRAGRVVLLAFGLCALLAGASCDSAEPPVPGPTDGSDGTTAAGNSDGPAWFAHRTSGSGVDFRHVIGAERRHFLPETISGGVALIDHDGDGDLDLYLVQGGEVVGESTEHTNRLYRNDGEWRFVDVTEEAGVGDSGYGIGCACADFDRDGDTDLYVTNYGPNVLYRNDGDGTFTDITAEAGVGDARFGSSAAFGDLDGDGFPELYIANYVRWSPATELECQSGSGARDYCSPNNYQAPAPDTLYRNRGDGTFEDISESSGIRAVFGNGLGVVFADLDSDGRSDIYVANDGMPNQLWRQVGPLRFEDIAIPSGCAVNMQGTAEAGMGITALDVDEDGDLDLFLSHLRGETNTYYRNDGGSFTDATVLTGLAGPSRDFTGFGVGFADLDHDGHLDLYVGNGRVMRASTTYSEDPYAEPDQLFRGSGGARFTEVLPRGGTPEAVARTSRGVAFGDLDGDGDIDLVVQNSDETPALLENVTEKAGGGLLVGVEDEDGIEAIGAVVMARSGERRQTRIVRRSDGYCASNDGRVHLGLGSAARVDELTVTWTDGSRESFGPHVAGTAPTLRRGNGTPLPR